MLKMGEHKAQIIRARDRILSGEFRCPFCDNGCRFCKRTRYVDGWTLIDRGWTLEKIACDDWARAQVVNNVLSLYDVDKNELLEIDTIPQRWITD